MSSKNRRLYQMGKMSVREFYGHHVRWIAEAVGKESVFEKPYLDEDRGRMHADPSVPDWPPMPPIPPWPPLPPQPPGPGPDLCAISCYEPLSDCDEPIWCHPSIWCGTDLGCTLCSWTVEGATTGFNEAERPGGGIEIWIDQELLVDGKALIHVQMTDPCGNLCGEDIEVSCKECPPDTSISWDTAAETIGQSDTLGVDVKDGLGPYKWSVSGTGYSMLHASTVGVSNTLQSDASACGTAVITVTDDCDETTTGYVRNTAGSKWTQNGVGLSTYSGVTWCYGAPIGGGSKYQVSGKYQWMFVTSTSNCNITCSSSSWAAGLGMNPPCGGPWDCAPLYGYPCSGNNPAGCTGYYQIFIAYWLEWVCN